MRNIPSYIEQNGEGRWSKIILRDEGKRIIKIAKCYCERNFTK